MRIVQLSTALWFPHAGSASPEGLVALGGDLSVPRLLLAYRSGIFPWTTDPITWWSLDPRAIFQTDGLRISSSLAKVLRKGLFRVSTDTAFEAVMRGCAQKTSQRPNSWVNEDFIAAYTSLHAAGHAHSVECWQGDQLVGGVYGVVQGGFFAGESMFHRVSNASKVALCCLMAILRETGCTLFDTQMLTPITESLGAIEIPRREYLKRLAEAVNRPTTPFPRLENFTLSAKEAKV